MIPAFDHEPVPGIERAAQTPSANETSEKYLEVNSMDTVNYNQLL
jgi:hypothetical protein